MKSSSGCVIEPEEYIPVLPKFDNCRDCKISYKALGSHGPCPDPDDPCSPCPYHGRVNVINQYVARKRSIHNNHSALSVKCVFSPGEIFYDIDGLKYTLTEESYLIINEGQQYHTFIESETDVNGFCVLFGSSFSGEVLKTLIQPVDLLLEDPYSPCSQPVVFFEKMYRHDDMITPLLLSLKGSMARVVSFEWFEEMLHLLLEKLLMVHRSLYPKIDELKGVKEKTRIEIFRRLSRARDLIDSSFHEPIDLSAMAEAAHLSKHHFLRLFSQAFGSTPYQYLVDLRLEKARTLIEAGSDSITEVCLKTGFRDLSNFNRLYKKRFNAFPRGLRGKKKQVRAEI
jgi:AraC-like DNA-binding protein